MPGRPAVEGAVEDLEGPGNALAFDPGRRLQLLLEEGVGDEVGYLEQAVGTGVAENGVRLVLRNLELGSSFLQLNPALPPSCNAIEVVTQQLLSVQLLDGEVVEGV